MNDLLNEVKEILSLSFDEIGISKISNFVKLVATVAHESQQEEKEIDEIQIERQRTHNGIRSDPSVRQSQCHLFQSLCVIRGETSEDKNTNYRDHKLQCIILPKDPDDHGED